MLFNSLGFLVFFALVFAVYWRLPHRGQNLFLLAASLFFYGSWNVRLLGLLVGSASIDYLCAIGVESARSPRARKGFLLLSVCASLGILGFFKYANFFLDSLIALLAQLGLPASRPALDIVLPVGISFYTFQAMSYAVDVYRGELPACRRYLDYLLHISFFPQLVAGPIERATHRLPQVLEPRQRLNRGAVLEATKLLVVGYAQKIAIADVLATTVERAFADPRAHGGVFLLFALYAFAVQVYCDFAGYSNIARGTARLLGFRLVRNFEQPYLSADIAEFWRRWHVSLSSWLRDYLFLPLGGTRRGPRRTKVNLMLTMLIGGLWHGASWTFVAWGGLHGFYLAVHSALPGRRKPARGPRRLVSVLVTFHLVCLSWVFFRAETFADAWDYLRGLARGGEVPLLDVLEVALYVALALVLDLLLDRRRGKRLTFLVSRRWVLETAVLAALVVLTLFVGENHVVPFVYFQF
jgi:D-alanyl-lipoteichoic acid acyltransferase DltB (MBOAT superfamily)